MKIKTTVRYAFTPVRMVIKKTTNSKCWQGCGEKATPCALLVGMQTAASTVEKCVFSSKINE